MINMEEIADLEALAKNLNIPISVVVKDAERIWKSVHMTEFLDSLSGEKRND